jgi:hypothetical protein
VEITADNNNSVLWLGNGDYNANIATGDKGGTKLVTSGGVETTVTIFGSPKDASRSYTTDASGKAANEDGYTTTAADGIMKNDRTLGEIFAAAPGWVASVKCADIIHNAGDVAEVDPAFARRWLPGKIADLEVLGHADPAIYAEARAVVARAWDVASLAA